MALKVKVIGAGSIGNHLTHACRSQGWDVTLVDSDSRALERAKTSIYPSRYGVWDDAIKLASPEQTEAAKFDVVIVGTPPKTHLEIAAHQLENNPPTVLLIEKPLSQPDPAAIRDFYALAGQSPTRVLVGYNQRYKSNTKKFLDVANDPSLGNLTGLSVRMLESWDGILKAHFWMEKASDSYLAFTEQGGGALLEHSHALNLFLFIATELGHGEPTDVSANVDWVDHDLGRYDERSNLNITLTSGLVGEVRQDLLTWPAQKQAVANFESADVLWEMGDDFDSVTLLAKDGSVRDYWDFPKTRPDDFVGEILHVAELCAAPDQASALDLSHGIRVMEVALAAFESAATGGNASVSELRAPE